MEGRRRLSYKLRTEKFDALMLALHGEKRVKDVAIALDMGPDNLSQVRSGVADMSVHMIACCVEELLPGIPLGMYAEKYVKSYGGA
jgi:hypothetical protein